MQNSSSVLEDIEAIIARAMAEMSNTNDSHQPDTPQPVEEATTEEQPWEEASTVENPTIPERVASVVISDSTSRFSGAIWYNKIKTQRVILAGLGGIGSYVALLLGRLDIENLVLYDNDVVETANMSGQLYGRTSIGVPKATAISRIIQEFTDNNRVCSITDRYTRDTESGPIMICGFDNMEARKTFFNNWEKYIEGLTEEEKSNCLFIDGRLAAEEYQVLCIKGDDNYSINRYKTDYLFSDVEADTTICSYKQTTFMANMIASTIVNLFVNFVANQCDPLIPRDLPFYTTYNAETMYFKVIA